MEFKQFRTNKIDIDFFQQNGYWLYKNNVFTDAQFTKLTAIYEELEQEVSSEANKSTIAAGRHNLDTPHFYRRELLDFLLDDKVLDIVEQVIGPDICLWSSHFISKEPFVGKATPWHEDAAYWNGRFDRFDKIITLWLAIDQSDGENGAMKVIPQTHHNGFSEYEEVDKNTNVFTKAIAHVNTESAVTFELNPNECSIHDCRIIHGADANRSNRRRCGYTMRYFSQELKLNTNHPMNQGFKIWHARGRNIHNNPVVN